MLALPLVVTLALAPTGDQYRVDLYAAGHFDYATIHSPDLFGDEQHHAGGRGGLGLTLYLRPLVDDAAPPSLQSFLQRTPELHLDGGGGSIRDTFADQYARTLGWADVSLAGYPLRFLYAAAHVGIAYFDDTAYQLNPSGGGWVETRQLQVPLDVHVGGRWRDLRISVGWGVTPTRVDAGIFTVPFWGGARVDVTAAVRNRLLLAASAIVLDGGAGAGGSAELYLKRRFAVAASVKGGHETPTRYALDYAGAGVAFVAWASSKMRVDVSYDFEWDNYQYPGSDAVPEYNHTLRVGFGYRR